jgi:hypothetical protein
MKRRTFITLLAPLPRRRFPFTSNSVPSKFSLYFFVPPNAQRLLEQRLTSLIYSAIADIVAQPACARTGLMHRSKQHPIRSLYRPARAA